MDKRRAQHRLHILARGGNVHGHKHRLVGQRAFQLQQLPAGGGVQGHDTGHAVRRCTCQLLAYSRFCMKCVVQCLRISQLQMTLKHGHVPKAAVRYSWVAPCTAAVPFDVKGSRFFPASCRVIARTAPSLTVPGASAGMENTKCGGLAGGGGGGGGGCEGGWPWHCPFQGLRKPIEAECVVIRG